MDTAVAICTLEATYKSSADAAAVEAMIIKLTEKVCCWLAAIYLSVCSFLSLFAQFFIFYFLYSRLVSSHVLVTYVGSYFILSSTLTCWSQFFRKGTSFLVTWSISTLTPWFLSGFITTHFKSVHAYSYRNSKQLPYWLRSNHLMYSRKLCNSINTWDLLIACVM